MEDYGGVVEVQSEHLTDQVSDDLAQSLPVWIRLCLDGSACRYQCPRWKVIRALETIRAGGRFDSVRSLSTVSTDYERQGYLLSSRGGCKTRSEELVCDGRGRQPPPNYQVVRLTLAISEGCSAVGTFRCPAWQSGSTVRAEFFHRRSD